jgi:DNA repair exonuclease SbcCD ATPase subunit
MKIIKLHCENIKKLKVVSITPDGSIIQITGPNASGKSSVLDAIYYALAGGKAIDAKPIREGQERATITLDLGEFTVLRTFKMDEEQQTTTKLEVVTAAGAKFPSPQKMLDALLGSLTFDPLAFSRAEPKQQLDMLRTLVPLEIDVDALDLDTRRDFEARTNVNRDLKALEAQLNGMGDAGLIDAPEVSPSELLSRMEQASDHNRTVDHEARRRSDFSMAITQKEVRVGELQAEIAELGREIIEMNAERLAWPAETAKVDAAELRAQIESAQERQREHEESKRALAAHDQLAMKVDHARMTSDEFSMNIARRSKQRADAIAAAKMPVEGLGFGEGEVTYNGHPFTQASGAEQLRVSVAIAMAGNPKLRVLRIKDASLLDATSLALLTEMAELHDFQCWLEVVDESGTVGVVMENGEVASVNA